MIINVQRNIKFFAAAFLGLHLSVSVAQNNLDKEPPRDTVNNENAKTLEACRALIGKRFWYRPGIARFIKPTATGDLPSRLYWTNLDIREETNFVVVDCKPDAGDSFCLFKAEFPDGSFGYLIALNYSERRSDKYSVMDHMYPRRLKSSEVPNIFANPPKEIFDAEERIASAKRAKAAAEWNARGGVRIGMTTAQVLNSNWGKPRKINRTTTARGTDEQWVYDAQNYLYFSDGILRAIQN